MSLAESVASAAVGILPDHLDKAVRRWIDELAALPSGRRRAVCRRWAAEAGPAVMSGGDVLRYGDKPAKVAAVFNHVARGLAALATAPGGVTWMGMHWCVDHTECERAVVDARTRYREVV